MLLRNSGFPFKYYCLPLPELEQSARELAVLPVAAKARSGAEHLDLFAEKEHLIGAYRRWNERSMAGQELPDAADCFLEHFYLAEKAVNHLDCLLDDGYFHALPASLSTQYRKLPRIFVLALRLTQESNGMLDQTRIHAYLRAFQENCPLQMNELWAFPDMLRLALIKLVNAVERETERVMRSAERARDQAQEIGSLPKENVSSPENRFSGILLKRDPLFAACLLRYLADSDAVEIYRQLETELHRMGYDGENLRNLEQQHTERLRATMINAMMSLRYLDQLDWEKQFRQLNAAEKHLNRNEVFRRMDEASQAYYRQRIAALAQKWRLSESAIAECAADCAAGKDRERGDLGYYLLDEGKQELAKRLGIREKAVWNEKRRSLWYVLTQLLLAGVICAVCSRGWEWLLAVIPALTAANAVVNLILSKRKPAGMLPRMTITDQTENGNTLVVIPCLLRSEEDVKDAARQLERHYLTNPLFCCRFALLGDFADAKQQTMPEDAEVLQAEKEMVAELNRKYAGQTPIFFVFQRMRSASTDGVFRGWERKRGALLDCMAYLKEQKTERFCWISHEPGAFRYLITLDSDTVLPPDAVRELIGTMEHPLNRFTAQGKKHRGYAVLQPAMDLTAWATARNPFTRIWGGNGGEDSYRNRAADLYQDYFGQGIYQGKGILDVDAFSAAMQQARIPENTVLSHDLLEGCIAGAGTLSDVKCLDECPQNLFSWWKRQSRWIRGDWQLLPFLFGKKRGFSLKLLSRWKIWDNLRRSLVFPAVTAAILFGTGKTIWLAAMVLAIPFLWDGMLLLLRLFSGSRNFRAGNALGTLLSSSGLRVLLEFCFLPYETYCTLNAVITSLYRMLISKKNLLQWKTARESGKMQLKWKDAATHMGSNLLLGTLCLLAGIWSGAAGWVILGMVWLTAPIWAVLLCRERKPETLCAEEENRLRLYARRMWHYFETFCTERFSFLPPDNFQESPFKGPVAHTSPTNMGFAMLAAVTARDLGYLMPARMNALLSRMVTTMEEGEKWKGHLYNWYDIRKNEPLGERYVSTVDSGNLAAALYLTAQALREGNNITRETCLRGLLDTAALAKEEAKGAEILQAQRAYARLLAFDPAWVENDFEYTRLLKDLQEMKDMETPLLQALCIQAADCMAQMHSSADGKEEQLAQRMIRLAAGMDFSALYDAQKNLFYIGCRVQNGTTGQAHYDLLASEARLTSYLCIATGQVPCKHWRHLGRLLAEYRRKRTLLSWSGTMFEYLMPALFVPSAPNTLLGRTGSSIVSIQKKYAQEKGIPWGISESGYYAFDSAHFYQYHAFGIPAVSLRTEQTRNDLISPYSTFLALPFSPRQAMKNLSRLDKMGMVGPFGFYEAADAVEKRTGKEYRIVKSYMAHHLGMSLCAVDNWLCQNAMQRRFTSVPAFDAFSLLANEKMPDESMIVRNYQSEYRTVRHTRKQEMLLERSFRPGSGLPETQVLSNGNGKYSVFLTEEGRGYSRYAARQITPGIRYPEAAPEGVLIAVLDRNADCLMSPCDGLIQCADLSYETVFRPGKAVFRATGKTVLLQQTVEVSPYANGEIRTVEVVNKSREKRIYDLYSYTQISLQTPLEEHIHPAFYKLKVDAKQKNDCLFFRLRQENVEKELCVACKLFAPGSVQYVNDSSRFPGRGAALSAAFRSYFQNDVSNAPLEPAVCAHAIVVLHPNETVRVRFLLGVADDAEQAQKLINDLGEQHKEQDNLAETYAAMHLAAIVRQKGENLFFERMIGALELPNGRLPLPVDKTERRAVEKLWKNGISGDRPIVVLEANVRSDLEHIKRFVRLMDYMAYQNVVCDLVILVEEEQGYLLPAFERIRQLISQRDGVFVIPIKASQAGEAAAIRAAGTLYFHASRSLGAQLREQRKRLQLQTEQPVEPVSLKTLPPADLLFFNGFGGFAKDGRNYVLTLQPGQHTPRPWSNLLAGKAFGALITESGGGYTWAGNSREYQLTPWENNPFFDPQTEKILLWEKGRNVKWNVIPGVSEGCDVQRRVEHGFGFSTFTLCEQGIRQKLTVFTDKKLPVKYFCLHLTNEEQQKRCLQVLFCARLQLGGQYMPGVIAFEKTKNALLARNYLRGGEMAFLSCVTHPMDCSWSGSRILGNWHEGDFESDEQERSQGNMGAVRTEIALGAAQSATVIFLLGSAAEKAEMEKILQTLTLPEIAKRRQLVQEQWKQTLDVIQVKTPDTGFDLLMNGWLLYQTCSARLLGKTAYYQASGATGFRDQLQDVLALLYAQPETAKRQILAAAKHQFPAGDVLHWWHEPAKGVRTHISDDRLFLPFVTVEYARITGDYEIFDQQCPYLRDIPIPQGRETLYQDFEQSQECGSLYQHCCRALDLSYGNLGSHDLPLMGSGDWNDGMDRVGEQGGESVWLAWFLLYVTERFLPVVKNREDKQTAERYETAAQTLRNAVEACAWDGEWYRRAFFGDGTPLGSAQNDQGQIDCISQSWAVLANGVHARQAYRAMKKHLVDEKNGLIRLLTPPFDHPSKRVGYIQTYVPGVRENAGQYTHGAVWSILAAAELGKRQDALDFFTLLNPIYHTDTREKVLRYGAEPYVMAGDVYTSADHVGQAGWTWYTGAAAWMYRAGLEWLLGFRKQGDTLRIEPCNPWKEYELTYRYGKTVYHISVFQEQNQVRITENGREVSCIHLRDDGQEHAVKVYLQE